MWFAAQLAVLEQRLHRQLQGWLGQYCVNCEQPSATVLCEQCNHALTPIGVHCQTCAREVADANTRCGHCLANPHAIDRVYLAYRYRSPLREIVLKAKYGREHGALAVLQQLILQAWPASISADLIVPMPIAKRRLAWRGFNQTHGLAKVLSVHSQIPMNKRILQKKSRKAQSTLSNDAARHANIRGAFKTTSVLRGHIVLVDDVLTSGATAREAASTLKAAGAERVSFVGIAAR